MKSGVGLSGLSRSNWLVATYIGGYLDSIGWGGKIHPRVAPFSRQGILGCVRAERASWEPAEHRHACIHALLHCCVLDCECHVTGPSSRDLDFLSWWTVTWTCELRETLWPLSWFSQCILLQQPERKLRQRHMQNSDLLHGNAKYWNGAKALFSEFMAFASWRVAAEEGMQSLDVYFLTWNLD